MHVHAEVNGLSGFKRKRQKDYIKLERERSRDREGIGGARIVMDMFKTYYIYGNINNFKSSI